MGCILVLIINNINCTSFSVFDPFDLFPILCITIRKLLQKCSVRIVKVVILNKHGSLVSYKETRIKNCADANNAIINTWLHVSHYNTASTSNLLEVIFKQNI